MQASERLSVILKVKLELYGSRVGHDAYPVHNICEGIKRMPVVHVHGRDGRIVATLFHKRESDGLVVVLIRRRVIRRM